MKKKQTIIILPVGEKCNLSCSYCYHSLMRDQDVKIMPEEILKLIISEASKIAEEITFLWHGGEPLLAGIDYFKTAVKLQNFFLKDKVIKNRIQSNLILLNKEWENFFVEHNISISTSLDGPREIHDLNRYFPSGRGSFDYVSNNIKKLRNKKVKVGCVTLITKTNVNYPEKVYKALRNVGVSGTAFHLCSETEAHIPHLIPEYEAGAHFLKRMFDIWFLDDDPTFHIRNFENIIRCFLNGRPLDCASVYGSCSCFVAIDHLGDVYPCNRFAGRRNFLMGNISNRPLSVLLSEVNPLYEKIIKIHEKCFECKWFSLCGGGCAYERLFFSNDNFNGKHPDCELKKEIFSYVWEYLEMFYNSEALSKK